MIRLAVFDCDGTLVDSQRRIVRAMEAAFIDHGLPAPDPEATRRSVGLALPHAVADVAPDGTEPGLLAAMTESFRQTYRRLLIDPAYEEPLYPGVVEALDALEAAGLLLAIATGKGRRGLDHTLERHGLAHRFAVLKTADDGPSKPHPQILQDAMAELGAAPETTVMLGDTAHDVAMARAAGAPAIGVSWGYHPVSDLERHGAARIIHRYEEAPPAVLALLERRP